MSRSEKIVENFQSAKSLINVNILILFLVCILKCYFIKQK